MKRLKFLAILVLSLSLILSSVSSGFSAVIKGEQYNLSDYEKLSGKKIGRFSESPQLTELVRQGKLPSLEERTPKELVIIEPWEEIGQYGGTWRRAWLGLSDGAGPFKIAYEHLLRWNVDGSDVVPNIVKKYDVSKDGRNFTFYLREGMKWSDGTPFTTDDIKFWFEDITLNKELTPTFPSWLTTEGKPCTFKVRDKYTFTVSFSKPNAIFPMQLAYFGGFVAPAHYLKQFHPKYTDSKKLEEMAKDAGFQFWYQLFGFKNNWLQNPELPSLWAWKLTSAPTATLMVLERNPYYWKIDPAGNQLPYIDKITHELVQDPEMINMKAVQGDIDMQMRNIRLQNYTLLMENRDKGNYRVFKWTTASGADFMLEPNQNVKDPVLKKLFQDRKFRFALSLAINREEINQLVFLGLGKPRQASLISASPY
ncbi:MAG TPA: ABC transporter substrate-binding protein, partial [bacterium]|nr:ABC transporter substrate-binding protein [bacterium]